MPDARVQAAIDNWAPRFTTNGVDPNDFRTTTARIERWEEWLGAWCETAEVHRALAEQARADGHARTAGEAFVSAAVCFHFAKFVWVVDAERNRATTEQAMAALYAAHELLDPTAERVEAPLDGAKVAGNLRRPRGDGTPSNPPLVILIPGLDSTKEEFFHWEDVFLTRGMATLSLDGPGQGESGFDLDIRADYEVAVAAVLDVLADRDDLDLTRVGAAGVSMGGYYAPRAAAFEPRIKAVAGVSGPYDMTANWDNLPSLTRETLQHHTGAGSPEEAREKASALNLSGVAERIAQPCLVITGRRDRLIPWADTKRIADEAPQGEWVLFDDGNHVCNNIPYKYRPMVGDWMRAKLGVTAAAGVALRPGRFVGQPLTRREDDRVLRGAARYVDDIELPGLAHAAFVRSPHAHARVGAVRVPRALPPGVLAVITPADLEGRVRRYAKVGVEGMEVSDDQHPVLPEGEVRYAGQPVVGVVAESRALAEDFAEEIDVEYEPLDAVVDPLASTHALVRFARASDGVDAAFARADHVVTGHYGMARVASVPIEARGAVALDDPDAGLLTVWISAQETHRPLAQLAHILDRPPETIRIIVPDVGGAFGTKGNPPSEVVVTAIAAMDLGRPVKWTEDRLENLLTTQQGRGMQADMEMALDAEGTILGIRARIVADLGAYLWPSTHVPGHTAALLMGGCYDVDAVSVQLTGAMTHKVPTGPYRGAGRPEGNYFVERLVDDAARAIGMDPVELRRRNLVRSFPYPSALGLTYDSGDYERCLDLALEHVEPERRSDERVIVGTGVGLYVERSGGVFESADVTVERSGRVVVRSSTSPHGQGHDTAFAQIAAERLGIGLDDVELRFGDSAEAPPGIGTFGSRSLVMGGSAVALAVDAVMEKARAIAEHLGEEDLPLAAVAAAADDPDRLPDGMEPGLHARHTFRSDITLSSGAHAAVVEIDRATGALRILRYAAVDDAGTIVNPLLVHGQVVGGIVQGIGQCLTEEVVHDEYGQLRSASLLDYGLPTSAEIPPLRLEEVESPSPLNPLGAKGAGEGGATGALPTLANAVADALGGRHLDPPFTSEKLWRALREAGL